MTIISAKKISGKGTINNGQRQYAVEYLVLYTGLFDEGTLALAGGTFDLPADRDEHPVDDDAIVTQIDATKHDDSPPFGTTLIPGAAKYAVTYSTTPLEALTSTVAPWDRPAQIEMEDLGLTIVRDKDSAGTYYKNSTGDDYDPKPETPVQGIRIVITRNEQANPASKILNLSNTVASGGFFSCANPKAKFGSIGASKTSEVFNGSTVTFWVVKYPIDCMGDEDGWHAKIIDNGFRILNDDGDPVMFRDKDGNVPSTPIKLNGSGKDLEADADPVFFPTAGFKPLFEKSWAGLSLPNPFA